MSKWEKRFDERFPNVESGYLNRKKENVWLFMPAVDARDIKQFIQSILQEYAQEIKDKIIGNKVELFTDDKYSEENKTLRYINEIVEDQTATFNSINKQFGVEEKK